MTGRPNLVLRALTDKEARWKTTVLLSLGLHVAAFFFVLVLPSLMPRATAGPPVYVVDLVSIPAGAPAIAPPAGGAPKATAPQKKTPPEKAIQLPDRQARKPAAKKTPEPKKAEAKPAADVKPTPPPKKTPPPGAATQESAADGAVTAPGATGTQTGGAGGTGSGSGDAFQLYGSDLFRRIEAAWQKPLRTGEAALRTMTVMVRLNISSTGRVLNLDLVAPSGYDALDRSVMQAIRDAQPFPSFPAELGSAPRMLQFEFVLNP